MSKIIEFIVAPDGSSKIETKGFSGAGCQEASRFLEAALGARLKETLTAEFYQSSAQQNVIQQGGAP